MKERESVCVSVCMRNRGALRSSHARTSMDMNTRQKRHEPYTGQVHHGNGAHKFNGAIVCVCVCACACHIGVDFRSIDIALCVCSVLMVKGVLHILHFIDKMPATNYLRSVLYLNHTSSSIKSAQQRKNKSHSEWMEHERRKERTV